MLESISNAPGAPQASDPFLLLPENRFAYEVVEQLQKPALNRVSSLAYVYGPSGVGKSHLAKCFLREISQSAPGVRVTHITGSDFAAALAEASESRCIPEFQQLNREADVLVLEDVQSLENRRASQQQLLSLLNELSFSQAQVLITSRKPAGQLVHFLPRLINRFQGGISSGIKLPGISSRERLIQHFTRHRQIPMRNDVSQLLAKSLPVSPRELLASLMQIETESRLKKSALDLDFVQRYLRGETRREAPSLSQISREVARQFGVGVGDLRSRARQQGLVLPRQCAMFLTRELMGERLGRIATYFGKKDHTTVIHACERVRKLLPDKPELRQHLNQIRQRLGVGEPEGL